MTADREILFCATPQPVCGPTQEQAVWKSLNNASRPNMGWLDWFGSMARCNPDTGQLEKVTKGTPAPDNIIFCDGGKLYAQPNYDFSTGKRVDPSKPAWAYFYAAGVL
jgi:hypothetical protein